MENNTKVMFSALTSDMVMLLNRISKIENHLGITPSKIESTEQRLNEIFAKVKTQNSYKIPKEPISPIIVRHDRYLVGEFIMDLDSKGGVTYAFKLDYKNSVAYVGVAVCSEQENFNKSEGRRLAEHRLKTDSLAFNFQPNSKIGLKDQLWHAFQEGKILCSKNGMKIMQSVKLERIDS